MKIFFNRRLVFFGHFNFTKANYFFSLSFVWNKLSSSSLLHRLDSNISLLKPTEEEEEEEKWSTFFYEKSLVLFLKIGPGDEKVVVREKKIDSLFYKVKIISHRKEICFFFLFRFFFFLFFLLYGLPETINHSQLKTFAWKGFSS